MSIAICNDVWEFSRAKGLARAVLVAIASHCDENGYCYPSQTRIAKRAGVSRPTVKKYIAACIELGELVQAKRAGGNRYHYAVLTNCDDIERARRIRFIESITPDVKQIDNSNVKQVDNALSKLDTLPPLALQKPEGGNVNAGLLESSLNHQLNTESSMIQDDNIYLDAWRAACNDLSIRWPKSVYKMAIQSARFELFALGTLEIMAKSSEAARVILRRQESIIRIINLYINAPAVVQRMAVGFSGSNDKFYTAKNIPLFLAERVT